MSLEIYLAIFTSWEFLAVLAFLLLLFPLLYTLASLDRSPVKIKKVPKEKPVKKEEPDKKEEDEGVEEEEGDDED